MKKNKKIKAYTLIEIMVVVIIITIFIWMFRWFSSNKNNKQIEFGEKCSQYIYQEIISEINDLKRNKIENISWTNYSQVWKKININSHTINFIKTMKKNSNNKDNKILTTTKTIISWYTCLNSNIKNPNNYLTVINNTWDITFTPNNIYISGNNTFEINTCVIIWNKEDKGDTMTCTQDSQIIFNQAAQTIDQKICINFSWNICNEWSK